MKKLLLIFTIFSFIYFFGCSKDENPVAGEDNSDIPADPTNVIVPATVINNIQPTANFTKSGSSASRIQMNLTGIINPVTQQAIQFVAQSNLFITEDGSVKGLKVTKVGSGATLKADVVFTVDNSGSMNEEADSVASSIIKFSQVLQSSGLNVRFAVVGYDVNGDVNGGVNFTNAQAIEKYLDHATGTSRTEDFSGSDSAALYSKALNFADGVYDEDGVVAIFFADTNYTWRSDAQRVFINFTDEATQPGGVFEWSTESLCNKLSGKATVHTVWSGEADTANAYSWTKLFYERPWDMSKCTGGTFVQINGNGTGLDLSKLPVTGALSNSYLVEYLTADPNKQHTVIITVKENNADGKKIYTNISY